MKRKVVELPLISQEAEDKLWAMIQDFIEKNFLEKITEGLDFLEGITFQNDGSILAEAIRNGRVVFWHGEFKGKFNSRITRELVKIGAKYNSKTKSWKIHLNLLPEEVTTAIRVSELYYQRKMSIIDENIGKFLPKNLKLDAGFESFFASELFKLDLEESDTFPDIGVRTQLSEEQRLLIAEEYSQNLEKYIKNFTEEQIYDIRERIRVAAYSGNRYENLIDTIQHTYDVTESKAKFLARQETRLLSAKYNQVKSENAGSKGYYWKCVKGSPNHPVRPSHKILDGEYITWDNPPVVDLKTGRRAHAGEDFNCRCRPRVVFGE